MLKAVAFDLWETLITDLPEIARLQESARIEGLAALLEASSLPADRELVANAHRETWHRCWALYWSNDRDVSARGQVCHFLEMLGHDPGSFDDALLHRFEQAYGRPAIDHPPMLVDGAREVVTQARAMGISVGVLSNTGRTPGWALRTLITDLGLGELVDAMVFSNEHGECKPLRSIFERLRSELGCEFEEMMFVGDNLFADVWGAQQCGMEAVHFAPPSRGNAVGNPTHDEWELRPHATVSPAGGVGAAAATRLVVSRSDSVRITTPRFTIEGSSRAGVESWYRVRELGLSLDLGRCPDNLIGVGRIAVTHAHVDHAAGVPYYAAQRKLQRLDPGTVYVPAASLDGFRDLIAAHERLENTSYQIDLIGIAPGEEVELRKDLVMRAHAASHPVPANAYEFLERRNRLRSEFRGLSPEEIERRRLSGVQVSEPTEASILFYTGDTDRRIFETCDAIFRSEVLLIECSFTWEDDRERARKYSHIHIDDIADVAGRFENKLVVLTHFSLRDSREEIEREVRSRLPGELMERVRFML